ncbi:MAG: septum formation protein Maf [Candidatus Nomurabacteria bacterium GW2011_GWF2_43_8]|uniref:dTTP/UTP pyrophosphatase n=3 Tax=Candidatus Nomuraibacteriota TaxID=1752729 RepID=A0A0G1FM37_9BACT|nr:MAG: septum formation protein Maf [Candidatus Nomurabacteria bacterium GW2011_GWA2_43_15]KKT19877.1 MAG: septum formation protein Maf [Candidatus Nomurabacteria bacterium GW2011_GWB1_43_7]KKT23460.1 MAG: septum formation protein Maf [Candidatus Nomurabacteria bacterium GW2011_GWF2_43_8]
MRKIILASTSPRRQKLLAQTGLKFEIIASNYDEDITLPLPPGELVKFISRKKAESVARNYDDAIVIGGDTLVYFDGQVLGKPHISLRAKEMLKMLSGNEHSIFTGFTVIDTKNGKIASDFIEAKVKFKNLSDEEINEYIETGEPLTRAGAYDIQKVRETFVERFTGDYEGIVGLPVGPLLKVLETFGVKL